MEKTTFKKFYFVCCVLLSFLTGELNAQVVIGTPNLGFSQACASESFNTYNTTFVFSPESALESSNQFIIELSDAEGSFSEPIVVFTSSAGSVTTSPATLNFALPTDTSGENYKIRIKSTYPASTSTNSAPFAAYYKIQDSPFTINNLVSTGAYCSGGSYLLTIDNPGTGTNDSPLNYPSLSFKWYKETGVTTSVFVAEGPSLEVFEEGTYFVETNYGTCTSNSFSNRVTIQEAISGEATVTIASSLGNPFCADQGVTTLTTIGGLDYTWYKDGEVIEEAREQMYMTSESGNYSVVVNLGECQASGSIDLVSEGFTSEINVPEVNNIEEGETLTVEVTTDAINPEFQWFYNDELILDETEAIFYASEFGRYKVIISQTVGCLVSKTYEFQLKEPFPDVSDIPNLISPNGDNINDTWIIPVAYVSGTDTEVTIMNNQGSIVFQTNDYQNDWPQDQSNMFSKNQVYYYIITTSDNTSRKGSITLIN